jgi:AcrR family transcriptional regulator
VNDRAESGTAPRAPGASRRTQAERRRHTRQALIDAALLQIEAGESFDRLSLRGIARAAGVVPTAFYRYFASMDELGLALIEDSFRTLRGMLRRAREQSPEPQPIISSSVEILVSFVHEHRQQFALIARARSSGSAVLRHAIRSEIRLFASELATDLTRYPLLGGWTTDDLQMLASLLVSTMIATVEALLELAHDDERGEAEIARQAERQLRLIMLGVPNWRSRPRGGG